MKNMMQVILATAMLASTALANASLIGVNSNVTITQAYTIGLNGYTSLPFGSIPVSGNAFSRLDNFLGRNSGCSTTACVYDIGYEMDLSGLVSGKTANFLSRLSLPTQQTDILSITVRSNINSPDSITALFQERRTSGQVQINSTTKEESIYSRSLRLTVSGEFFSGLAVAPLTSDDIERLWEIFPFQYLNYEESFSNTTFTKGVNGSYSILAQNGEAIVGGMNGAPNAMFSTFVGKVPEPGTASLTIAGLLGFGFKRSRLWRVI